MNTDVLIVGAGLAGCTLGLLLQKAGRDALSVELRDSRDKDKLCAGALERQGITTFDMVYGAGSFMGLSPYAATNVTLRCLNASYSRSEEYWTLPRKSLDDYCLQRYVDEGGRLIDRAKLVGIDVEGHVATFRNLRNKDMFEVGYRTLVGADGASSTVRRLLCNRAQRTCPSMQGIVSVSDPNLVFEYDPSDVGYYWYFPHKEDAVVGCMLHRATGSDCRARLVRFCHDLDIEVPPLRGAPIPEGDDVLLHANKDTWLVGDAAGLIDAPTGGGILYALKSAHALAAALEGGIPYELAMGRTLAAVEANSQSLEDGYLKRCFFITARAAREAHRKTLGGVPSPACDPRTAS